MPLLKISASGLGRLTRNPKLQRLGDFFAVNATTTSAYQAMRGIFSRREAEKLVILYCPDSNEVEHLNYSTIPFGNQFPSMADEISYLEITRYMRNQLLRDSDVMSMRFGLELRVPFVDKIFLETISKIPSQYRLTFGKKLLVNSVPEIPEWVINRPKQGFSFPFQQWLDKDWLENFFHPKKVPKEISVTIWYRKWLIIVLNYWLQEIGC
jgi:asparagine synthase (glutamine-hydrolysing)